MPSLSHLTNGTPAKLTCNLYFVNHLPDFSPINLTYILLKLSSKSDVRFLLLMACRGIHLQEKFCYTITLYSDELLATLSTAKLQDDPFLAVCYLINSQLLSISGGCPFHLQPADTEVTMVQLNTQHLTAV